MFAHQVLDDYTWVTDTAKNNPDLTHAQDIAIRIGQNITRNIKAAHKFNIANIDGLFAIAQSHEGSKLFLGDLAEFVRMPYKTCWFDYENPSKNVDIRERSSKRGILVFEVKNDLLNVFIYAYMDRLQRWVLGPQGYTISVGNPMSHHPDVVSYGAEAARSVSGRHELPEARLSENMWLFPIQEPTYDVDRCMTDDLRELSALNCVLMLLNCKNIATEKHNPPLALNKKRAKKGKHPLFTYHTLALKPTGVKQESIPRSLWNNRIHLQRGHFKTYTAEKPLFGHIVGRFWWQPHLRGKNREGMVVKDYAVSADV